MFNFSQNAFKVLWVRNLPDSEKKKQFYGKSAETRYFLFLKGYRIVNFGQKHILFVPDDVFWAQSTQNKNLWTYLKY